MQNDKPLIDLFMNKADDEEKKKKLKEKIKKQLEDAGTPYFDYRNHLLTNRQLFLNGPITDSSSDELIQKLWAIATDNPAGWITLWINSPGGSVTAGLSILDMMERIPCPIATIVSGQACSMAGIISICGDKRYMMRNSIWMAHEMHEGACDYHSKVRDRIGFYDKVNKRLVKILKTKTKLSESEIHKCEKGELWLFANQSKKKGVTDKVC